MKIKLTRTLMVFTAVLLVSGGLVAYASTTLFTQTFSGQTFKTPLIVVGSCGSSLVVDTVNSEIPTYAGGAANFVYACDTTGGAAFTTPPSSISITPTFTVPSGWTLGIMPVSDEPSTCSTVDQTLTNGTPVTFSASNNYVYCLSTASASNFTSFSITWSQ